MTTLTDETVETVLRAYIECALWSSNDEQDVPLDVKGLDDRPALTGEDLAPETLAKMREDVASFLAVAGDDLTGIDPGQVGHDFWLTRNHHGAGFWDRGLGDLGDRLTTVAHAYGEQTLYVGDDGKVHL